MRREQGAAAHAYYYTGTRILSPPALIFLSSAAGDEVRVSLHRRVSHLADVNPTLRPHLLPLLSKTASSLAPTFPNFRAQLGGRGLQLVTTPWRNGKMVPAEYVKNVALPLVHVLKPILERLWADVRETPLRAP